MVGCGAVRRPQAAEAETNTTAPGSSQDKADWARRAPRGIDEQVATAEKAAAGMIAVKRNPSAGRGR
jgi:hypothetical protein